MSNTTEAGICFNDKDDFNGFEDITYPAKLTKFLYERYRLPFYMTENGCAVTDIITEDKKIHDGPRIEYYKQYLKQLRICR